MCMLGMVRLLLVDHGAKLNDYTGERTPVGVRLSDPPASIPEFWLVYFILLRSDTVYLFKLFQSEGRCAKPDENSARQLLGYPEVH